MFESMLGTIQAQRLFGAQSVTFNKQDEVKLIQKMYTTMAIGGSGAGGESGGNASYLGRALALERAKEMAAKDLETEKLLYRSAYERFVHLVCYTSVVWFADEHYSGVLVAWALLFCCVWLGVVGVLGVGCWMLFGVGLFVNAVAEIW